MINIVSTRKQVDEVLRDLKDVEWASVDIETPGFEWLTDKICMLQIAYIKNKKLKINLIDASKVDLLLFKPFLEDPDIVKIIHGSIFDCKWLKWEYGITTVNIYDTMQQEKVMLGVVVPIKPIKGKTKAWLDEIKPLWSSGLSFCLERRGLPAKLEFEEFTFGKPWTKGQITYSARDVEFLHVIKEDQENRIGQLNMENVMNLENFMAEIFYKMSCRGFTLNEKGWWDYADGMEKIYNKAIAGLSKFAQINWQAPGQTCKFFGVTKIAELEELDVATLSKDKQKAYRFWEDARATKTVVKTFGKEWLKNNAHKGKVHCDYTQIVNTGRCASDHPNLQNIPVKKTVLFPEGFKHRQFFIPSKGKIFGLADFSGQELAIMAIGSQEPEWLATLRAHKDLHQRCADLMSKSAGKEINRRLAKTLNFTMGYGGGAATIVVKAKRDHDIILTEEQAKDLISIYFRTFPKLRNYLYKNGEAAITAGETYSFPPFNRRRVLALEEEDWRKRNIGKNSPIQSTGADMTKLSMYYIDTEFNKHPEFGAEIIHQLHDELVNEFYPKYTKKAVEIITSSMNRACTEILGEPLSMPDVKIEKHWNKNEF